MANRALYERARPVPAEATWHDHWFALTAAVHGNIRFLASSTILYRQHDANQVGASGWSARTIASRARDALFRREKQATIARYSRQARALLERFAGDMSEEQCAAVRALAELWSVRRRHRFRSLFRNDVLLQGAIRNLGLIAVTMRDQEQLQG